MSKQKRVSWEKYFINIAKMVSERSTCSRKHVGAVIVKNKTILSTGYNGSIRGLSHCDHTNGEDMEAGHCSKTIHGEQNAIVQAAKNGVCIDGADIYITASPCWLCFKMIANAGIKKIYYLEFYRDDRFIKAAIEANIKIQQIQDDSL